MKNKGMPTHHLSPSLGCGFIVANPRRMHACPSLASFHCTKSNTCYHNRSSSEKWAAFVRFHPVTLHNKAKQKKIYDAIFKAQHKTQSNTYTPHSSNAFSPSSINKSKATQPSISSVTRMQIRKNARLVTPNCRKLPVTPNTWSTKNSALCILFFAPALVFKRGPVEFFFSNLFLLNFFFSLPYRPVASDPLAKILGLVSDRKLSVYSTARVQTGERHGSL